MSEVEMTLEQLKRPGYLKYGIAAGGKNFKAEELLQFIMPMPHTEAKFLLVNHPKVPSKEKEGLISKLRKYVNSMRKKIPDWDSIGTSKVHLMNWIAESKIDKAALFSDEKALAVCDAFRKERILAMLRLFYPVRRPDSSKGKAVDIDLMNVYYVRGIEDSALMALETYLDDKGTLINKKDNVELDKINADLVEAGFCIFINTVMSYDLFITVLASHDRPYRYDWMTYDACHLELTDKAEILITDTKAKPVNLNKYVYNPKEFTGGEGTEEKKGAGAGERDAQAGAAGSGEEKGNPKKGTGTESGTSGGGSGGVSGSGGNGGDDPGDGDDDDNDDGDKKKKAEQKKKEEDEKKERERLQREAEEEDEENIDTEFYEEFKVKVGGEDIVVPARMLTGVLAKVWSADENKRLDVRAGAIILKNYSWDEKGVYRFLKDNDCDVTAVKDVVYGITVVGLIASNIIEYDSIEAVPDLTPGDDLGLVSEHRINRYDSAPKKIAIVALHAFNHGTWQDGVAWFEAYRAVGGDFLSESRFNNIIKMIITSGGISKVCANTTIASLRSESNALKYRLTRLSAPSLVKAALKAVPFKRIRSLFNPDALARYRAFDEAGLVAQIAAGAIGAFCRGVIDPMLGPLVPGQATIADLAPLENIPYDDKTLKRAYIILEETGFNFGKWYQGAKAMQTHDYEDYLFRALVKACLAKQKEAIDDIDLAAMTAAKETLHFDKAIMAKVNGVTKGWM